MNSSILSSLRKDFCLFYMPSLVAACLCVVFIPYLISSQGIAIGVFYFFMFYMVDAGHTFLTGLRVFRRRDQESALYLILIFYVFIMSLLCVYWKPMLLFRFYIYATVYHHIRQHWGLTAWYQKLNKRFDARSRIFSQTLLVMPFLAYHFDPEAKATGYFQNDELLLFPSTLLFQSTLAVFVFMIGYFVYCEIQNYRKYGIEWNRIMSIVCPTTVQTLVFLFCKKSMFALIPLSVGHGLTYAILIGFSLHKVSPARNTYSLSLLIGVLALVGGLFLYLADLFLDSLEPSSNSFLSQILIAVLTLPAIWHYVVDAFIWKSQHPEAALIYADPRYVI